MTRETTRHGPRLDDALKKETRSLEQGAPIESRVQEGREHEGPGDLDWDVNSRTAPPGALGHDQIEARRELSRHLRMKAFPADRDGLLAAAEQEDAPLPILTALQTLPGEQTFQTVHEVWAALVGYADVRNAAAHEPLTRSKRETG
jgi:hypothetical protein